MSGQQLVLAQLPVEIAFADPRNKFVFDDPLLKDKVADDTATDDLTESGEIIFGTDVGIVTDIQSGPDGSLYLVSPSSGTIRRIAKP